MKFVVEIPRRICYNYPMQKTNANLERNEYGL